MDDLRPTKKNKSCLDELRRILGVGVCGSAYEAFYEAFYEALYEALKRVWGEDYQAIKAAIHFSHEIVKNGECNPVFGDQVEEKIVKFENTEYTLPKHVLDAIRFLSENKGKC